MKKILALFSLLFAAAPFAILQGCGNAQANADTLNQAVTRLNGAGAYHAEFNVGLGLNGGGDSAADLPSFSIAGNMDVDSRDTSNIKLQMNGLDIQALGALTGGSTSQTAMSFIKDTMYIKYSGNWYELDTSDIPNSAGTDPGCLFRESTSLIPDSLGLSALTDVDDAGSDQVDGVDTRHFTASLDASKYRDVVNKSTAALQKCDPASSSGGIDTTGQAAGPDVQKMFDMFAKAAKFDIWLDSDNNVRRMKMAMDMNMSDLARLAMDSGLDSGASSLSPLAGEAMAGMEDATMHVEADLKISNIGQPADIKAPDKVLPFEDLMNNFGGSGGLGFGGMDSGGPGSGGLFDPMSSGSTL